MHLFSCDPPVFHTMSIPYEHVVFPFSPNFCVTRIVSLLTSVLNFTRSLQLFSKNPFLYLTVFPSTVIHCTNFPTPTQNASYRCMKYSFFKSVEIFSLKIRLLSAPVALLACSILFNTYSLHSEIHIR